jgi:hypothetical protein
MATKPKAPARTSVDPEQFREDTIFKALNEVIDKALDLKAKMGQSPAGRDCSILVTELEKVQAWAQAKHL